MFMFLFIFMFNVYGEAFNFLFQLTQPLWQILKKIRCRQWHETWSQVWSPKLLLSMFGFVVNNWLHLSALVDTFQSLSTPRDACRHLSTLVNSF